MNETLAYRTAGNVDAPPLILLHAVATSSALWEAQIPVWAQHFRVVAFDLPGHGASAVVGGEPGIIPFAEAVAASCADLGIAKALFVGLSLGSMVVQRLAADRPSLVTAAVLSNGACTMPPQGAESWRARMRSAADEGMAGQVEETLERWFTPTFRRDAPLTVARIGEMVRATSLEGYVFAAAAIASLDQRTVAERIACPALVIAGEHDVATPLPLIRVLAEAVPNAQFVTLPAPHLANIELPVAFTERVGAFLMDHRQ